jgi:hypothetical protein
MANTISTEKIWWRRGLRGRVKRNVQSLSERAEQFRLEYKYRRAHKKFGIENPIIVHQMGKVGSRSFYYSLKALDLDVPVYHTHVLAHLDEYQAAVRAQFPDPTPYLNSIDAGRTVRAEIEKQRWKQWNVISIVRAPIPRSISQYFETLHTRLPRAWERIANGELTVQDLQTDYIGNFQDTSPLNWFEDQIHDPFGIDVYATPFETRRGYQIYAKDSIRLLIVRLEDADSVIGTAMRDFLGLENFALLKYNETQSKHYSALYQKFSQSLRLPNPFIEQMHGTRYARHFYTPAELEASVRRWHA